MPDTQSNSGSRTLGDDAAPGIGTLSQLGCHQHGVVFPHAGLALHAMLTSAGVQLIRRGDAYHWDGQQRGNAEFCLLQHTLAGRGELRYEDSCHPVLPGTTMLLCIPHRHSYYFPADSQLWQFFYICLCGREVNRIWRRILQQHGPLLQFDREAPALAIASQIVAAVVNDQLANAYAASSQAYALGMALLQQTSITALVEQRPPGIDHVIDYCRRHYAQSVSVETLAAVAGYSRYHFSRLFRLWMGTSPASYLQEVRLRHAVRCLQQGDLNIKQIANACGFQDANYFSRVFRQHFGLNPGAFRTSGMY